MAMAMSGWRELTPSIIALCDELPRDRALRLGQSDGRRADCASCAMGCPPRPTASPRSITRPGPMPRRGCGWTTTSARTSRWAWRPQPVRQGLCPDRQLPPNRGGASSPACGHGTEAPLPETFSPPKTNSSHGGRRTKGSYQTGAFLLVRQPCRRPLPAALRLQAACVDIRAL